ncbi:MAG TPA: hypothetical protein VMI73_07000 [Trebonia sp.]|nr:hypothetical protein [Trebonia sp.]
MSEMGACSAVGSLAAAARRGAGEPGCCPPPGGGGQAERLPAIGGGAETCVGDPWNGPGSDCAVTVGDGIKAAPDWAAAAN